MSEFSTFMKLLPMIILLVFIIIVIVMLANSGLVGQLMNSIQGTDLSGLKELKP